MNEIGMKMLDALDGIDDDMLKDALPPGMGIYKTKEKRHRLSGFFDHPWVAAVISVAVALAVLSGIIWAGQQTAEGPAKKPDGIAGNPGESHPEDLEQASNVHWDTWPVYDNPPVPEDAKITISSGGYIIAPEEYLIWKDVWNPEKGSMEEVRGAEQWSAYFEEADSGADTLDRQAALQNLPRVPFRQGDFSAEILAPTLQFYAASAYDDHLRHAFSASLDENFDSAWSLEDVLAQLSPGSYCILLVAYEKGQYVEAAEDYEDAMYEFLFLVDIPDSGQTVSPEPPSAEVDAALGMELWVGNQNLTYLQLKPYVTSAYIYKDEKGAWADVGGHGVDPYDPVNFPILTYAPGFTFFFKPVDRIEREAFLDGMTIYAYDGNNYMLYEDYHDVTEDFWQLSQLKPGTYLIKFTAHHKGRELDGTSETGTYEYAFRLVVPNEYETSHPTFTDQLPDDVCLDNNGRRVYPVGKNEWTHEALISGLSLLPVIYESHCTVVYPDQSYSMVYLEIYKKEGDTLTKIKQSTASNLAALATLDDGEYCVAFSVQHPDPEEEASMLLRSYAFLYCKGYEASSGVVDA